MSNGNNDYLGAMARVWRGRIETAKRLPLGASGVAHLETVMGADLAETARDLADSGECVREAWLAWYPRWVDARLRESLPAARMCDAVKTVEQQQRAQTKHARYAEAQRDRDMAAAIVAVLEQHTGQVCALGQLVGSCCGRVVRADTYRRFARVLRGLEASRVVVPAILKGGKVGLMLVGQFSDIDPRDVEPWEGPILELFPGAGFRVGDPSEL